MSPSPERGEGAVPAGAPIPDEASPVEPGPAPDRPPPERHETAIEDDDTGDRAGWSSTAAQGLVLTRWVAAELVAQRIDGVARVSWIMGAVGLLSLGLSLPVDPGWPLIVLGIILVVTALATRVTLAVAAALVRRLALPRHARHLRAEAAAAGARLRQAVGAAGVPVSVRSALGFVWALARGRRPHRRAATEVMALATRLDEVVEVAHLRALLAEAASGRSRDRRRGPERRGRNTTPPTDGEAPSGDR